jgi:EmrB/QacA subfamily drug resistance transporter
MSTSSSPPNTEAQAAAPFWLIPLVVASALFMENMDSTVIATSLPAIAGDLGEDPVILKLAFTAYLLSLAVFIPVSGWCADRFGARRIFQAAILVFSVASIGCAMARDLSELVAARTLQGVGGAMMVPVGRLILLRSVPKKDLVRALAWLTTPALVAPVVGPLIGGFITTYFHWRWIFWINIPFGVLAIVLAQAYMPASQHYETRPMDWRGFFLSGCGFVGLIAGASVMGRDFLPGWAAPGMMAAGAGFLWLYVLHARRAAAPMLDLALFRIATFRQSVLGGSFFRIAVGAIPFLLPLLLQVGFGLNPFQSGAITFAAAAGALAMKITAQPILRQFGFRTVLTVNGLICAAFFFGYALFTPETAHWLIFVILIAGGFFRSLQFTALNALAYSDVDEKRMSQATGIVSVGQQVALSGGVALAALVLEGARQWRGDAVLTAADFGPAFAAVAGFSVVAALIHARLAPDAGAEVSGKRH